MKRFLYLFIGIVATAAPGCDSPSQTQISIPPVPSLGEPVRLSKGFVSSGRCTPLSEYRPPVVGLEIIYLGPRGNRISRRVEAVADDLLTISLTEVSSPGQVQRTRPPLMQRTFAGLLPASGGESSRQLVYAGDPIEAVGRLALGQTVQIDVTESTSFGGRAMALEIPAAVKYETCGALSVGADNYPVRVYRVSSGGRSYRRGQLEKVRRSEVVLYLSESLGYPLAYQGAGEAEATIAEIVEYPGR